MTVELLVIDEPVDDPLINLEREDRLFELLKPDNMILRFWQNTPCVVMGRFQKEEYEVNKDILEKEKIPLLRRQTGGGTVYHDEGTLNVTLLKWKNPPLKKGVTDISVCTEIICSAINRQAIPCYKNERNSLFLEGKKILGSAAALTNGCSHFHCSILFNTNLKQLERVINWNPNYDFQDKKFVQSIRSPVTNLSHHTPTLSLHALKESISLEFQTFFKNN